MEKTFEEDEYLLSLIDEAEAILENDRAFEEREIYTYSLKEKEDERLKEIEEINRTEKEEESCYECPLYHNRELFAEPIIKNKTSLLFIKGSPDGNTIFSPDAFIMWKKWIELLQVSPSNVSLTTLLKCPSTRFSSENADICKKYLKREMDELSPKALILLGEDISHYMLRNNGNFSLLRKRVFNINRIPVFVTYSPSQLLKEPQLKKEAWIDLQGIRDKLKEIL